MLYDEVVENSANGGADELVSTLHKFAPKVNPLDINNIAARFYGEEDKEYWNYVEDFPAPFIGRGGIFFEWEHPKFSVSDEVGIRFYDTEIKLSALMLNVSMEEMPPKVDGIPDDAYWVQHTALYIKEGDQPVGGPRMHKLSFFMEDGTWCTHESDGSAYSINMIHAPHLSTDLAAILSQQFDKALLPVFYTCNALTQDKIYCVNKLRGKKKDYAIARFKD